MNRECAFLCGFLLLSYTLLPSSTPATNGYFVHGVGIKAKGMGGASVALSQDAIAGAYNPAAAILVGDRFDIGMDWHHRDRGSEIVGNTNASLNRTYDANARQFFFVPEAGVNKMVGDRISVGISIYSQDGINTSYKSPVGLLGVTDAGCSLVQIFIAPSMAVRVFENHILGFGLNLARQRFEAKGLENFNHAAASAHPGSVTNNGHDVATGIGFRVGWLGRLTSFMNMGVAYQSRTSMGRLSDYRGFLAEEGDFDAPEMWIAGLAVALGERAVLAVDVANIRYGEVKAMHNPLVPNLDQVPLGHEDGAGFGWEDVTVYKLGLDFVAMRDLTVRGGFNYGKQPIPASETLLNVLAPTVVEKHVTLGATWTLPSGGEVSGAYIRAMEETVTGAGSIPPTLGGGEANLRMFEDSLGLSLGIPF